MNAESVAVPAHKPVLFETVMKELVLESSGFYVDGTFGRGGHSLGILQKLGPHGRLLALDKDPEAVRMACHHASLCDPRFSVVHSAFSNIDRVIKEHAADREVSGVLLDLGVSSPQLDQASRGFSFRQSGPLDMRMDTTQTLDAARWISRATRAELYQVIRDYGEERYARRIADAIVQTRQNQPITRTDQLSQIISQAYPWHGEKKHPATRTFQAIRMFINQELDELITALPLCAKVLKPKGRLCVISFHSLEDREVKRFIQKESRGDDYPRGLPVLASAIRPRFKKIHGLIRPDDNEIRANPRARSARLRITEKIL